MSHYGPAGDHYGGSESSSSYGRSNGNSSYGNSNSASSNNNKYGGRYEEEREDNGGNYYGRSPSHSKDRESGGSYNRGYSDHYSNGGGNGNSSNSSYDGYRGGDGRDDRGSSRDRDRGDRGRDMHDGFGDRYGDNRYGPSGGGGHSGGSMDRDRRGRSRSRSRERDRERSSSAYSERSSGNSSYTSNTSSMYGGGSDAGRYGRGGGGGGSDRDYRDDRRTDRDSYGGGGSSRSESRDRDRGGDRDRDRDRDMGMGGRGRDDRGDRGDDRGAGIYGRSSSGGAAGGGGGGAGPYGNSSSNSSYGGRGGGAGRGGGFAGGRGGRGGGGRGNAHMNSESVVSNLVYGSGMTDEDIMQVIQPSADDIASRKELLVAPKPFNYAECIPPVEAWRSEGAAGVRLNQGNNLVIRSNHYRVDVGKIPLNLYHYHLSVRRYDRNGVLQAEDIPEPAPKDEAERIKVKQERGKSKDDEMRLYTSLLLQLKKSHLSWFESPNGKPLMGLTFDGRSSIFTSSPIPFEGDALVEDVQALAVDGSLANERYQLTVKLVESVAPPAPNVAFWKNVEPNVLRALDSVLFNFARWQQSDIAPRWVIVNSKVFPTSDPKQLQPGVVALQGYYAALKASTAGLSLVTDLAVSAFLESGEMVNVMAAVAGYRCLDDFLADARRGPLSRQVMDRMHDALKGTKIKLKHLGHWRKVKSFGVPANHIDSEFDMDGVKVTVEEYFNKTYGSYFGKSGKLQYPYLPTININSNKRKILIPAELIVIPSGQTRAKNPGDVVAQLIRFAAVKPDDRQKAIQSGGVLQMIRDNGDAEMFGVSGIAQEAIAPNAVLLPPARIQYKDRVVEPGLTGSWHSGRFVNAPPGALNGAYLYGMLVVEPRGNEWRRAVDEVIFGLNREASVTGVGIKCIGSPVTCNDHDQDLTSAMRRMREQDGVRFIVVIMCRECYNSVKLAADRLGIITQCIKYAKIEKRAPGGYFGNLMLKINVKLGGTNHTLASRLPDSDKKMDTDDSGPDTKVFQSPPASLSWVFDKPCMLLGIDVSHPEAGASRELRSIAAVVGSVDGSLGQYVAHISAQERRLEIVDALEEAVYKLIGSFRERNGDAMPEHIIVYRDGVSDTQFASVLERELTSIKAAIDGYKTSVKTKVSFVICQKAHHTRFVYESNSQGAMNLCPGVCVDGSTQPSLDQTNNITSAAFNEFYLTSHTALQGTSKPTKYSLIYDEIGIKLSELELLTYWVTYTYCRCNKSVSIATPCYYAHWAAKRARCLLSAGASESELNKISNTWADSQYSSMFFV